MTFKDKLILILLSIITLGIYPLVIFKRTPLEVKTELSADDKLSVNIDKLRENLGTEENIVGVEFTHTKVKIYVKEKSKVSMDALSKQKGISGVFATSKSITIIVGNSAKTISEKLI